MSESSSSPSSSPTSTPSATETIISTIASTITSSLTATATATYTLAPTPIATSSYEEPPSPTPYPLDADPYKNPNLLCDWTRTANGCRDASFVKYMLVASSAAHLLVALYGLWLLSYRNRGFNKRIFTDLFTYVGTGVRPKPVSNTFSFLLAAHGWLVRANAKTCGTNIPYCNETRIDGLHHLFHINCLCNQGRS